MTFDIGVFARNLKKYRVGKNLTQQVLAELLHVSPQSVSKWECGQSVPEIDKLCSLGEILHVSLDALLEDRPAEDRVLIGVDGGGTKTEFILFRETGALLKRLVLDGANPNLKGLDGCVALLRDGLSRLLEPGMDLAGLYIGCAGFLSGDYGEKVREMLQKHHPRCNIQCHSDVMNIIACGSSSHRCLAAICGTGSVVYANENRVIHRLGGGSYLLDTNGSGFDIGRDVLRTALSQQDGIGQESLITTLVTQRLGCPVWEAVPNIYREGPSFVSSFAPIAFDAYARGDALAEEILRKHAEYLANLIQKASKLYDCGTVLVLAGSIFTKTPVFRNLMLESLPADIQVEIPAQPPVYGACLLACELCGIDPAPFARQFAKDYESLTA